MGVPMAVGAGNLFGLRHRIGSGGDPRTLTAEYDNFTIVPEPSTYALAGIGLIGLAFIRKRQNKN